MPLTGQGTCTITFNTVAATGSITVQGAGDAPSAGVQTPTTVTGIGTAGVITNPTANQVFSGTVLPQAVTFIRLNVTALGAGTLSGSMSCTDAPTTTSAVTIPANSSVNVTQVQGSTLAQGVPIQYFGKTNTVGQPCWGMSAATGTAIPSLTVTGTLTASTPVQVVALVAAKNIHVCNFHFSGVTTTGADIAVEYGTGAICATGTTVIDNIYIGVNADVWKETGNGTQDVYALPSANALCINPGAFVGTLYYFYDYAQY